ncbi:MAG: hypothetical protein ABSG43_28270, partial [Solirubrobacteraceae bacterium]
LEHEHQRDRHHKPASRHDRPAHQARLRQRQQSIAQLRAQHDQRRERLPNPTAVLQNADQLERHRRQLSRERVDLHDHAVDQELASEPHWLQRTLGPEPADTQLASRWHKAAQQTAGYRINHHITDPQVALGADPGGDSAYRSARRTIIDTRAALGLDKHRSQDRDLGLGH